MVKSVVIWILALIGPVLFLFTCLKPGCGVNFIPFAIHESLLRDMLDESTFIILFDIVFAVLLTVVVKSLIVRILTNASKTRS